MMKRILVRAVATAALLTLGAGPAQATDGPAFVIYFYSEQAHQNLVGFADAHCYPDPHAEMFWGFQTAYREEVVIGECVNGQLVL